MTLTADELIDIWKYYQYCCLPSITMARYAVLDYLDDIKKEKSFYRHETKQKINRLCKTMDALPGRLMDVSGENIRYMNILGDNIDEQFEDEKEELHRAIYITFRNAKLEHLDCLAALHYISVMMQIAAVTYTQCCNDLYKTTGKDLHVIFQVFDLREISDAWSEILDLAEKAFCPKPRRKKEEEVINLNNIRCMKAVDAIRRKYSDIETLRKAMKASYPWSINYREDIPYEESADYLVVNNNKEKSNGMD